MSRLIVLFAAISCLYLVTSYYAYENTDVDDDDLYVNLKRTKRTKGKYVGCFQDAPYSRLMKGFVKRMRQNHVELCVDTCRRGNFVYAGLGHTWCFCDNYIPRTGQNRKLSDSSCDTPCEGDQSQMCGHSYINSVYETGIEQYLLDDEGRQHSESYIVQAANNYYTLQGLGWDD